MQNDDSCIILAIDVGGSKFVIGYVETNGTILCQKRYTWGSDSRTPTIVVEEICSRIDQLKQSILNGLLALLLQV